MLRLILNLLLKATGNMCILFNLFKLNIYINLILNTIFKIYLQNFIQYYNKCISFKI